MICSNESCNNEFTAKTHNQKYCSDECCKIATNIKIKEKYIYKKARLSGQKFICKNIGCNQVLNRFTNNNICEVCKAKERNQERKKLLDMLNGK